MKSLLRYVLAGAALTLIGFLAPFGKFASSDHDWVYHLDASPVPVLLLLAAEFLVAWIAVSAVLALASRSARLGLVVFPAIAGLLPWMLLTRTAQLNGWPLPARAAHAVLVAGLIGWLALVLLLRSRPSGVASLGNSTVSILRFGGVLALLLFGEAAWFGWQGRAPKQPALHVSLPGTALPQRSRVIWILFDELSYKQVYETRFPGLALPAFDRLAAESSVFTQVTPAANFTEFAVPAMLTGRPVVATRSPADGSRLELKPTADSPWAPLRQEDSVFHDALALGYRNAAVGWYNPYCRIFAAVLDRCRWGFEDFLAGMDPDSSLATNATAPLRRLAEMAHRGGDRRAGVPHDHLRARIANYQMLQAAADAALADPSLGFVFVHLPVPHPPGFYNRRTGRLSDGGGSYIDNLALADAALDEMRRVLESRGEWDSSTVLVMGDHSWRTTLVWRGDQGWTAEDEAASSGGQFDPRPAFLLKLPGQTTTAHIDRAFSAVHTRGLIDRVLQHQLNAPEDVAAFAAAAH